MLHFLTKFFAPSKETHHAYALYARINEESRQTQFFKEWGVPDTLDGRFEMILLHMFMYLRTLKDIDADSTELQRQLIEAFFEDMDRSLREFGVGDTGVSKRVKNMANAFYGRIHAFDIAIGDDTAMHDALVKNTFATAPAAPTSTDAMVRYINNTLKRLKTQPINTPEYLNQPS
jgi:cytochrome b pre-mRNA-processing protein 3